MIRMQSKRRCRAMAASFYRMHMIMMHGGLLMTVAAAVRTISAASRFSCFFILYHFADDQSDYHSQTGTYNNCSHTIHVLLYLFL